MDEKTKNNIISKNCRFVKNRLDNLPNEHIVDVVKDVVKDDVCPEKYQLITQLKQQISDFYQKKIDDVLRKEYCKHCYTVNNVEGNLCSGCLRVQEQEAEEKKQVDEYVKVVSSSEFGFNIGPELDNKEAKQCVGFSECNVYGVSRCENKPTRMYYCLPACRAHADSYHFRDRTEMLNQLPYLLKEAKQYVAQHQDIQENRCAHVFKRGKLKGSRCNAAASNTVMGTTLFFCGSHIFSPDRPLSEKKKRKRKQLCDFS
jgi:hypothetical protein